MDSKLILNHKQIEITMKRLAYEVIENHDDLSKTALVGMQPRGIFVARIIRDHIESITGFKNILYGELDITFYRDDFRTHDTPLTPSPINIDFDMEGKNVILIDDVLYTGRSVRSAMDALIDFGRPARVELLALIDRRYSRENPVSPTYVGKVLDTRGTNDKVKVEWKENNNNVWLNTTNE
ncbi:MAG: bifunctional pyr operon transcriptional regulator/uracil phosphoribosyltransferase PyrR [Bacteroidia bacterium]|nr:bifunctional pyr operon transcriptional regulator/uracil phosphoribosyltransferase PyrR [Bacteroidia bacterium]